MEKVVRLSRLLLGCLLIIVGAFATWFNTEVFIQSFEMSAYSGSTFQHTLSTVLVSEAFILINAFSFICGIGLLMNKYWGKICALVLYGGSFLICTIINGFERVYGEPRVTEYFSRMGMQYESESFVVNVLINVFFVMMALFSFYLVKHHGEN